MEKRIIGLRCFLLATLHLISSGESESCTFVDNSIQNGIASVLFLKHRKEYEDCGIDESILVYVDEYYKKMDSCVEDHKRKYCCEEKDGLLLLIAFALNEI